MWWPTGGGKQRQTTQKLDDLPTPCYHLPGASVASVAAALALAARQSTGRRRAAAVAAAAGASRHARAIAGV